MMWQGLRDSYCEDDAIVIGIVHSFVILNLFQDNKPPSHVILKQVQDDELWDDAPVIGVLSLQTYTQNAVFL
jgi:hypothetical protein